MFWLLVIIAALVVFSYVVLRGENLGYLDRPIPQHPQRAPSPAMRDITQELSRMASQPLGHGRTRVRTIRNYMDDMGRGHDYASNFVEVQGAEVSGEWVLAPGYSSTRRILYIHGGAFFAGSPLSHRPITDRLARLTGASVFTIDYRLMPEHPRIAGIDDCRNAYRWILENGPEGKEPASFLVVAGDSAGGSLTLMTLAWARDERLRPADAGVALSPTTDAALNAPSLRENIPTDPMLGPAFGRLVKLPKLILLWYTWITTRMFPSDPRVSPLRGSLADLPPILIQASDSEMLLDDSRRYAAKAEAAGSPVQLQTWPDMVHEAYQAIGAFLRDVEGLREAPAA